MERVELDESYSTLHGSLYASRDSNVRAKLHFPNTMSCHLAALPGQMTRVFIVYTQLLGLP